MDQVLTKFETDAAEHKDKTRGTRSPNTIETIRALEAAVSILRQQIETYQTIQDIQTLETAIAIFKQDTPKQ